MMPLNHIPRKCTAGYKLSKSQDIKVFAKKKMKKNRKLWYTPSGHRDGIWHRKMCYASHEKRQTTPDRRNGTVKSRQDEKRKPTNTWVSWKLTPSNKWSWKKRLRKNISGEPESYSRQNYRAETLSKEYIPRLYSSLDIRDHFWSGPEKNLCKWTKEQEN